MEVSPVGGKKREKKGCSDTLVQGGLDPRAGREHMELHQAGTGDGTLRLFSPRQI